MNIAQHSLTARLFGLLYCAILFQLTVVKAQPTFLWDKTFGGNNWEELHSIKTLSDGNLIFGGNTQSQPGDSTTVTDSLCGVPIIGPYYDYWLVKTDVDGNKIWDKRFGGSGNDRMWVVHNTKDGGFLCGGTSNSDASCQKKQDSFGEDDWWIVKTDADGNLLWEQTYGTDGDDELWDVVELEDGSILALGQSYSGLSGNFKTAVAGNSPDSSDMRLAKIDKDGNLLWDRTYGGTGDELGQKIIKTEPGTEIVIGGQSTSKPLVGRKSAPLYAGIDVNGNRSNDMWVLRLDLKGDIIWDESYGGTGNDIMKDMEPLDNGNFLIAGQSNSGISGNKEWENKGESDFWLVEIAPDGTRLWDRAYGGSARDDGYAIHVNDKQEILFGGVSRSGISGDKSDPPEGDYDYWMLFLEPDGEPIWDVSFGGSSNDALYDITPVSDGGVLLGGHSASNASGYKTENNFGDIGANDWWIVKTDCKLNLDLGPDTTICEGTKVLLDALQLNCNDCQYRWSDDINERDPIREFGEPVTRTLDVYVSSRSGCEVRDTITVNVNSAPKELFAGITPPRCPEENTGAVQIVGVDGGTAPYYYSFNRGPWQTFPDFFNLGGGEYTLDVIDINECTMDSTIVLKAPPPIDIIIDGGGTIKLGEKTTLIPLFSEPVDSFFWKIEPTLSCFDCLTPIAAPLETTSYTLTAFDEKRCKYIASTVVALDKKRPIFFPTGFSPNNDGDNDLYQFYIGAGVSKINTFRIYDRWGELLFEVKDYVPGEYLVGWDGRQQNRDMPNGPYVYYCDVEFIDGWKELIKGHFTLVR